MAASDQSDWYSSDESDNESRFSGRNSDVSSNRLVVFQITGLKSLS